MWKNVLKFAIREFVKWLGEVPSPGTLQIRYVRMREMAIEFAVALPALPPEATPDKVDHGQLTVDTTLNGAPVHNVLRTERDQTEVPGITGDVNTNFRLEYIYVDPAGNVSVTPSVLEGVLVDTFPPPNPGELGIRITGEV